MDVDTDPAPRPDDVIMGEEEKKEDEPMAQEQVVPLVTEEKVAKQARVPLVIEKKTEEKALELKKVMSEKAS